MISDPNYVRYNDAAMFRTMLGSIGVRTHLRLRVSGRRFNTKRARTWVKIGLGSADNKASSKLGKKVGDSVSTVSDTKPEQTHSTAELRPSTFPLRFVNLHIKAYAKRHSHRLRGWAALLGGHMWPFFSVVKSPVAGLMIGERGKGGVSEQEGRLRSCEPPITLADYQI